MLNFAIGPVRAGTRYGGDWVDQHRPPTAGLGDIAKGHWKPSASDLSIFPVGLWFCWSLKDGLLDNILASQNLFRSKMAQPSKAPARKIKPTTDAEGRIDFNRGVPELLYRQAGGRCSVPRCKKPTMGPFYKRDGAVNMGVACHIYSAAKDGPRGRGGKDADFIRSEKNGIWCCEYHSPLIDKARGCDYPAEVLFSWKALIEARVLKEMNDFPSPLGWVDSIEFSEYPGLNPLPKIILSQRTLMTGRNCSGKSSLMEAAASISHSRYMNRFSRTRIRNKEGSLEEATFRAKVTYSTVDSLSKEIDLEIRGIELFRRNGTIPYLLPPGDIEIIYCSESDTRKLDQEDDIDFLMRALNVDKSALFALAKRGAGPIIPGDIAFVHASESDDDTEEERQKFKTDGSPYFELMFKRHGAQRPPLSFDSLSSSEKARILLNFIILKAREVSKERLTLLLIESLSINFDSGNFETLLRTLSSEDFQVIVLLPPYREEDILKPDAKKPELLELDYLNSWQLSVIGAEN